MSISLPFRCYQPLFSAQLYPVTIKATRSFRDSNRYGVLNIFTRKEQGTPNQVKNKHRVWFVEWIFNNFKLKLFFSLFVLMKTI